LFINIKKLITTLRIRRELIQAHYAIGMMGVKYIPNERKRWQKKKY